MGNTPFVLDAAAMTLEDPHHLQRFVEAQGPVYHQALAELQRGCKTGHWMWFIFPQLVGLGQSPTSRYYGLCSLEEAWAYQEHPLLGPRLLECAQALLAHAGKPICSILPPPDDLKLRSSMTLFQKADSQHPLFGQVLAAFFHGEPDPLTLRLLKERGT